LRDDRELEKAAARFNGLPILSRHRRVLAADAHDPRLVIGATGTNARWIDPYIYSDIVIWAQEAIDGIDSGNKAELSAGYVYDAHMVPGEWSGMPFDGRMVNIKPDHIACVPRGRAGRDITLATDAVMRSRRRADYAYSGAISI
jgi:hypothetical protein